MDKSYEMGKNIVLITNRDYNDEGIEIVKDAEAPIIKATLDEKISETLKRDFTMILHKIEYVLKPRFVAESHKQLRNCIDYII